MMFSCNQSSKTCNKVIHIQECQYVCQLELSLQIGFQCHWGLQSLQRQSWLQLEVFAQWVEGSSMAMWVLLPCFHLIHSVYISWLCIKTWVVIYKIMGIYIELRWNNWWGRECWGHWRNGRWGGELGSLCHKVASRLLRWLLGSHCCHCLLRNHQRRKRLGLGPLFVLPSLHGGAEKLGERDEPPLIWTLAILTWAMVDTLDIAYIMVASCNRPFVTFTQIELCWVSTIIYWYKCFLSNTIYDCLIRQLICLVLNLCYNNLNLTIRSTRVSNLNII